MPKQKTKKEAVNRKLKTMINYPVGDFLIRLKNASLARQKNVEVPFTKFLKNVSKTLQKEGYLDEISEEEGMLKVRLTFRKKIPNLTFVKLVSTPGLRIYMDAEKLESIKGPSIFIVSTSKGVMTSNRAIKSRLGGEVIAEIL